MKKKCAATFILLTVLSLHGYAFIAPPLQHNKTVIFLPDEYVVSASHTSSITLGQIADRIDGDSAELVERLAKLPITQVPEEGSYTLLSHPRIFQAIRSSGISYFNVFLEGAIQTKVLGPGKEYAVKDLVSQIFKKVQKETGWAGEELVFRVVSTPTENLWLPPSELEIDIARVNPQVIGTARYEVSFFKDKILLKKVPFVICVSRRRPVFIPIRNIDRGELLSKENVREVVQLITNEHLDSQLVDSVEELIGRQSKMPIKKGTAIKWFSLETNYLTKRGDAVQMIVRNGGMTLQTTGVAQQRGAKGDVITVKTKATGKVLKAKVLARGLVELVAS